MMSEKMEESLIDAQKRFNFLWSEGIREEVEMIHIFYEDCRNCGQKEECPNKDKFEMEAQVLINLHERMEETGLDSELHPLTSEDNDDLAKVVCDEAGVMPVATLISKEIALFSPEYNFLIVEFEDEKKYIYTTELDLPEDSGDIKAPLMYR